MTTVNANRDSAATSHGLKQQDAGQQLQRSLRASVSEALDVRRKGHGLHGMVLAIRDSLAQGKSADELATKIDTALDAASKHLAELGYSQDEIDTAVARFRDRLSHEIDAVSSTSAAQSVAVAAAAREVTRERFSLDVLTAEGDRVSIRFKSLSVTEVAAAQVSDAESTSTAVQASVISRGRFKVEVDGDLNAAERAAIGDLLDEVDDVAQDFFGGDVQAAFAAASRVGLDSDALSAFSLRLSYSRSVAVQAYAKTAAIGAPATPATPAPAPTVPAPSVSASTPAAPSQVADVATPAPVVDSTDTPATDAPSARQTIASFTKDVLARLASAGDNSPVKFSMRWKVEFLISAISSVTPAQDAAAQSAVSALGDSLSA